MSEKAMSGLAAKMNLDQINALVDDVATLSRAIDQFPKELDTAMQKKVNRLIDITQEIEFHANNWRKELSANSKDEAREVVNEVKKALAASAIEQKPPDNTKLYVICGLSGFAGTLLGASLTVIALNVWL